MKKAILALGLVFLFAACKKEIPQKQLTVNVTPEVGGSVNPSTGTYAMGTSVKLLATPSPEYVFKEWSGGYIGTTNPANIVMNEDKTITAVFEKREYPLSLTIVGSGSVKEEIIKIAASATNYKSGTTVRLTPQPSDGYEFNGWSGDDTSKISPLDIVISKPTNLTCTFIKEDAIKFKTNLDTGTYNVTDTLPLNIIVSSKLPKAGILYSILVNWTDSAKQIFKVDSSSNISSLSLKIPGLKKSGSYSVSVTVTSKSSSTNTLNKSITVVNNPLGRFEGYKVNQIALALSKQNDFGRDYWRNSGVMMDLIINVFQKPLPTNKFAVERNFWGGALQAITTGDFNNDGWIDVFNAGGSYAGNGSSFAFLMWDPVKKSFYDTTLFNDKSFRTFGGNRHTCVPLYLNDDNFVDMVIYDNGDEGISNSPDEPIRFVLSDGKGGYDLKQIETSEKEYPIWKKEHGDVGDLNEDGIPDLVLVSNQFAYIYWGIKEFPFFKLQNHVTFVGDMTNFGNKANNGFGDIVSGVAGSAFTARVIDINKDNKNDILIGTSELHSDRNANGNEQRQRIIINQGKGRFNNNGIIKLPFNYANDNIVTMIQDCLTEDLNGDGLLDIVALTSQNDTRNNNNWAPWDILVYIQQKDGSFSIDRTYFEYSINNPRKGNWKKYLIYFDFNGDGKKDISYTDDTDGFKSEGNATIISKSVFIRSGNKFIETDFYQFDLYAKSIFSLLK